MYASSQAGYAFCMDPAPATRQPTTHIGTRELRANVAAMIRRANNGERLVITVDGKPHAVLGPIENNGAATLDSLYAAGLAVPPRGARRTEAPLPSPLAADVRLGPTLDSIRGGT